MVRYFVLCCLLLVCFCTLGQSNLTQHTGVIILRDGDTIHTSFSVDLSNDLVQATIGSTIKAYSARQIEQFSYFDDQVRAKKYFFSLPFNEYSDYKVPTLFELVFNGTALSLLSRESLTYISVPQYDAFMQRTTMTTQQRLVIDLFFRNVKGVIKRYRYRKRELFSLMRDKEKEIKTFMKSKNLGYSDKEDIIKIVDYYNSISKTVTTTTDEQ